MPRKYKTPLQRKSNRYMMRIPMKYEDHVLRVVRTLQTIDAQWSYSKLATASILLFIQHLKTIEAQGIAKAKARNPNRKHNNRDNWFFNKTAVQFIDAWLKVCIDAEKEEIVSKAEGRRVERTNIGAEDFQIRH